MPGPGPSPEGIRIPAPEVSMVKEVYQITRYKVLAVLLLCLSSLAFGQQGWQQNTVFPPAVMTATSQTSSVIHLSPQTTGNPTSYSVGTITITGSSLTTATFAVNGSSDGGKTYYALNISALNAPGTTATTETVTTAGAYQVNLSGITDVEFVTSGTFTATSVSLTLTASPNGIISRTGGSGGNVTNVTGVSPIVSSGGDTPAISCPTCGIFPSGVQGEPLINTAGSNVYATSTLYLDASQFTGATPAEKINACGAVLLTNNGGTCDASALGATTLTGALATPQNIDEQITWGATGGNIPMTLILPNLFLWVGTMTDGTSCDVLQYANTTIMTKNPPGSQTGTAMFASATTSSLGALFCIEGTNASAGSYIYDSGFQINNGQFSGYGAVTADNAALYMTGFDDVTTLDHVGVSDKLDTYAVYGSGLCCSTTFRTVQFNAFNVGTPLYLLSSSATGVISSLNIVDSSIVHNGTNEPLILISDTANHNSVVNISNLYSEVYSESLGLIQIAGAGSVNLSNITLKAYTASMSSPWVEVTNTTNTFVTLSGLTGINGSGSWLTPVAFIDYFTSQSINAASITGVYNLNFFSNNNFAETNQFGGNGSNTANLAMGVKTTLPSATVTGNSNIGIGGTALTALTSGSSNVAVGSGALVSITTAGNNTAMGVNSGVSGTTMVTNANSSFFGNSTGCNANALSNDLVLGYQGTCTASNQVILGNASITDVYLGGTTGTHAIAHGVAFESAGTKFTASGCSNSATTGGATAGKITLATNTCNVVITLNGATGVTATNGWSCNANDETTAAGNTGLYFSTNSATTATLTVPATAGTTDVVDFNCTAY